MPLSKQKHSYRRNRHQGLLYFPCGLKLCFGQHLTGGGGREVWVLKKGGSGWEWGLWMGGAEEKDSKSLRKRRHSNSQTAICDWSVCWLTHSLFVCVCMDGRGWLGEREGERERERKGGKEESFYPQGLSWACAQSYKKTGKINSSYCGRENWYQHRHTWLKD